MYVFEHYQDWLSMRHGLDNRNQRLQNHRLQLLRVHIGGRNIAHQAYLQGGGTVSAATSLRVASVASSLWILSSAVSSRAKRMARSI